MSTSKVRQPLILGLVAQTGSGPSFFGGTFSILGWRDVVFAGPLPAFFGSEATAVPPAIFGGRAAARMVLTEKRLPAFLFERKGGKRHHPHACRNVGDKK
jgi:hypothetical protein